MTGMVATPDTANATKRFATEAEMLVARANEFEITDQESYEAAATFGQGVKGLQKRIVKFFAEMKRTAREAWQTVVDSESEQLDPTKKAESIIKTKMLAFQAEERLRQLALQREREQLARKHEEERRLQEALDLEEDGDREGAEDVLRAPINTQQVAIAAPPLKVSGVTPTKRWTFDRDNVDIEDVLRHVVGVPKDHKFAHPELVNIVALDEKVTQQLITAMKGRFSVPGIRTREEGGISLGTGPRVPKTTVH